MMFGCPLTSRLSQSLWFLCMNWMDWMNEWIACNWYCCLSLLILYNYKHCIINIHICICMYLYLYLLICIRIWCTKWKYNWYMHAYDMVTGEIEWKRRSNNLHEINKTMILYIVEDLFMRYFKVSFFLFFLVFFIWFNILIIIIHQSEIWHYNDHWNIEITSFMLRWYHSNENGIEI